MKNAAKPKRPKKDSKTSKETSKGGRSSKTKQPKGRPKSITTKKRIANEKKKPNKTGSRNPKGTNRLGKRLAAKKSKSKKRNSADRSATKNKRNNYRKPKTSPTRNDKQRTTFSKVAVEKTTIDIIHDLKRKGRSFKDISKSLGIEQKDFLSYRKFLLGLPGGKIPKGISREDILKEAKKSKVGITKMPEVFKGEAVGKNHIKLPKRIDKSRKYIHLIYEIEFTYTDGMKSTQTKSQIYQTRHGKETIQELATEFYEAILDYPYVLSLKLKRFGYRYF